MSSPSERFECHWQASTRLLTAYAVAQGLAWLALWLLDITLWACLGGLLLCLAHAAWVVPRTIALSHPQAFKALRCGREGWQVWSAQGGWQAVEIAPDSLVLPLITVVRFRLLHGERPDWRTRSVCIVPDALAADLYRRLRVRLRFARHG